MKGDKPYLQIRLASDMRQEIQQIASRLDMAAADVARGSLYFGLPMFAAMADLQGEITKRMVKSLKAEARGRKPKSGC